MKTVSFKTRARTVDHLGREQIADVPTAISELWKNSYDAYARSVSLTIFDEDPLVVSIADDGHGMSYDELVDRWLVIGTESKLFEDTRSAVDMDGLEPRSRQGQKGIGRLSSAHLGPLLLLVTKRRGQDLAAALIDWRLFENPYLILSDIELPVVSFPRPTDIVGLIPGMAAALLLNVSGDGTGSDRSKRIESAWQGYDQVTRAGALDPAAPSPSQLIRSSSENFALSVGHLSRWPVWSGAKDHGTAMVVSGAHEEFAAFLPANRDLVSAQTDRRKFINTLGGFVDPLFDPARPELNAAQADFDYAVYVGPDVIGDQVVGSKDEFSRSLTDEMEHVVDGRIDERGFFTGQIKSFGKWQKIGTEYVIPPPKDLVIPTGPNSRLGPVDIYIATFEQEQKNSTHTPRDYERLRSGTEDHAGLMIYRDGLRVLPYGREDNDFFEIERRRSINAGREYWNARRMFGRLAISRANNPNLRDKAGREGFIVNTAAKTLKVLVTNVLRAAAYDYFGSNSEDRQAEIVEAQRNYAELRAREHQAKLRAQNRKKFRKNLNARTASIPSITERIRTELSGTPLQTADDIPPAQEKLERAQAQYSELRLPGAPSNLGTLEDDYRAYRKMMTELDHLIAGFGDQLVKAVETIKPPAPEEIVSKQIQRTEAQLASRVTRWTREIRELQDAERERISTLVSERNKLLRQQTGPLVEQTASGSIGLSAASRAVSDARGRIDAENELLFQNYILALESLRDSIDIQAIAVLGGEENVELRSQVDRLNGLAQLGITVEFLDHEFHGLDSAIVDGLGRLSRNPSDVDALRQLSTGYAGLKQIMDFLGPLRMAGRVESRDIAGVEIHSYVAQFFRRSISDNSVTLAATDAFRRFRVFEQPSRLLPVFINLVNNSLYWVVNSRVQAPTIVLDVRNNEVVVADNGPGVDEIDVKRLFSLFFTRKAEGGRGVGLYLCQANLAAGGHSIRYVQDPSGRVLPGANFSIKFRGAKFDV